MIRLIRQQENFRLSSIKEGSSHLISYPVQERQHVRTGYCEVILNFSLEDSFTAGCAKIFSNFPAKSSLNFKYSVEYLWCTVNFTILYCETVGLHTEVRN